jgi:hypothetical protein
MAKKLLNCFTCGNIPYNVPQMYHRFNVVLCELDAVDDCFHGEFLTTFAKRALAASACVL